MILKGIKMKKAVCIISGGMDSALGAYIARDSGYEIIALHFDYNQRTMKKEKECFFKISDALGAFKTIVLDLSFISTIGGNALTDTTLQVPKDGLKDFVPITYVPFRNGIFLSIAAALAQKENCSDIIIGVVEEDSSGYPDCTTDFINSMNKSINLGTGDNSINIQTPLINLSKSNIVKRAKELNVPLELTWSCYENDELACGKCDSCRLRLKGFKEAGFIDNIKYLCF